ncbi:hypothetical protein F4806DRAFT_134966 [Annulohypoxylon nitens]|nr:hypothetical protein F4806DRAFT_134966 [Annulohypoxylon nitens]
MLESISENEVPFLSKEDEATRTVRHGNKSRRGTRFLMVIVAIVSAFVSAIATVIMHNLLPIPHITSSTSKPQELLPSLNIPPLGNVLRTYIGEPAYYANDMNVTHKAWMSLFPPGMGYVSMDNIKDAGEIPQIFRDMSTDGSGRFCVAAFHQLHCLFLIYSDFRRALNGELKADAHSLHGSHSLHCYDYLRESIICAADSALEPFRSPFDGGTQGNGVDGFGSVHQCRNFGELYEWSEKFRYTDKHDAEKFEG